MHNRLRSYLLILALLLSANASAQLKSLNTEFLRLIYYDENHAYLVPHLARSFENSLRFHRKLFHYTPSEKVTILMHDFGDYGHGGTSTQPWNYISIGIEPFDYVYETMPANERMNWLMHHELVHVVATDKATGSDKFFRKVFRGKVTPIAEQPVSMFYSYLTSPRWYSPRWYHEGIAVFLETWMAGGLGRVLGGYDEMVFRTMVRDSSYFYDLVGLESEGTTIDFQVGQNSYLYGTRFVSYLAYTHGPEKVIQWFNRSEKSKRYFATQFKRVFGLDIDRAWGNWIAEEHDWQKENLAAIRAAGVTPHRAITDVALGSLSRAFYDAKREKIIAAVNYPGRPPHIATIDLPTGKLHNICDIVGSALYYVASLAYDETTGDIYFTTDNTRGWRDLNVVNIDGGKPRRLLENCRVGNLVFNKSDASIWGVQHHNGISTLVKIPKPYKGWVDVYKLPYGKDIFDIDISPDGKMLTASLVEISGRQRLVRWDIAKLSLGLRKFDVLYEFENNSPENFVFSPDGRYLYGTSYYTGVSNVWRYDFQTQKMDVLTNCETGYFRPIPFSEDSLIVFRYSGKGFVPEMIPVTPREEVGVIKYFGQEIVEKHPVVKKWIAGSPAAIHLDSLQTYSGEYKAFKNLQLASVYPVVEGYKDVAAVGVRFNFADPIGLNAISLTGTYSPSHRLAEDERVHLQFRASHWPWEVTATYNGADFYDLFGPTKVSRKGYSLGLKYNKILINERPKKLEYTLRLAGYGGLERLPEYQNVFASFDKSLSFSGNMHYQYIRRSIGAVDEEQGIRWQLVFLNNYVNSKNFPRAFTNLDLGLMLPLHHSSLWLRNSFGYSFGEREEPFANFYFGGFGNNWVDYQNEKRYREFDTFPGVEINAIGGINYVKSMLEWTLPSLRFRRIGMPSLYLRWMRPALFASGLITNFDSKRFKRQAANLGVQLDFRIVMFSLLNSTFSAGYAVAAEEGMRPATEFMFSLKIL